MGEISKFKKQMKNVYISELEKQVKRLQAENIALKTNPEGVVGKFLQQLEGIQRTNDQLSGILVSILEMTGGVVAIPQETIAALQGKRLRIAVKKDDEAGTYEVSYRPDTPAQPERTAALAGEIPGSVVYPQAVPAGDYHEAVQEDLAADMGYNPEAVRHQMED